MLQIRRGEFSSARIKKKKTTDSFALDILSILRRFLQRSVFHVESTTFCGLVAQLIHGASPRLAEKKKKKKLKYSFA